MGHKKSLKRNLLIALLAGSAALYTMPIYAATSVIANNALPSGGQFIMGRNLLRVIKKEISKSLAALQNRMI